MVLVGDEDEGGVGDGEDMVLWESCGVEMLFFLRGYVGMESLEG